MWVKKETSLNYIACLSEYFPFRTIYSCENCESFSTETYLMCDTMPEFPEGNEALKEYLKESLQKSKVIQKYSIKSTIYVTFVVMKNGEIANIKLANMKNNQNINPDIENETIKIIKSMPSWKPGIYKGNKINVQCMIPVNIDL